MPKVDLTDAIFHDEDKAREHFEKLGWPDGPFCPHCGETEKVYRIQPSKTVRPGLHHCNSCEQAFTITVGSVMESSHLPLTKWALGFHLMASGKKGVSAKQLQRQLGIGYRAAWFMAHRIRTAMTPTKGGRLGGEGKVLESDETFVGGKAKTTHKNKPIPRKHAVHALVERGGHVRATHVADVSARTLRETIAKHADPKSALHTDDALANLSLGKDFAEHKTVVHTDGQYVSEDGLAHTQTVESFFAILKRGVTEGKTNVVIGIDAQIAIATWATMATITGEFIHRRLSSIAISNKAREVFKDAQQPFENWRIWIGSYHRRQWDGSYVHACQPIYFEGNLVVPNVQDPSIPLPTTQWSTFVIGKLYLHTASSMTSPDLIRDWGWQNAPRARQLLVQIWPLKEHMIVWPIQALTDTDAWRFSHAQWDHLYRETRVHRL